MENNIYLCGWTALEVWQCLRCMWKPRLDQLTPLSGTLRQLHIKPASITAIEPCSCDARQTRLRAASALERLCDRMPASLRAASCVADALGGSTTDTAVEWAAVPPFGPSALAGAFVRDAPLELMAPEPAARRNSGGRVFHVHGGPIPDDMFVDFGEGLLVTSPAFTLAQVARGMSLAECAMLSFELRGAYATGRFSTAASQRCLPLIGSDDVDRLLARVAGLPGAKLLRAALPLSLDRAASVMETSMVLLACAPPRLGGYGLPMPRMNACLPVPAAARNLVGWPWVACDALWDEARVALEYDGRGHEDPESVRRDLRRANALSALGLKTVTLRADEFFDAGRFDKVIRQVARHIGHRLDGRSFGAGWSRARDELRKEVTALIRGQRRVASRARSAR